MLWIPGDTARQKLLLGQVWLMLWRQVHTVHSHIHAHITRLTPEPPDATTAAPSPVMSPWYHLLSRCFSSILLCHWCGLPRDQRPPLSAHSPQLTVDRGPPSCRRTSPRRWCRRYGSLVQTMSMLSVMWCKAAGGHAGGWRNRGRWGTARRIAQHGCLFLFTRQGWLHPW